MPLPIPGVYNGLIPQPTDEIDTSQLDLLNNFGANQNFLEFDGTGAYLTVGGHGAFASIVPGTHAYLEMPDFTSAGFTAPAIQGSEMAIYCNTSLTGQPDIFIQKEMGSTAPVQTQLIPMTAADYATPGWTYLPSGIILKWGTITQATNTLVSQAFPTSGNIPVFTACLTILLTVAGGQAADQNTAVQLGTITATNFDVRTTARNTNAAAANTTYYYLAIGY